MKPQTAPNRLPQLYLLLLLKIPPHPQLGVFMGWLGWAEAC